MLHFVFIQHDTKNLLQDVILLFRQYLFLNLVYQSYCHVLPLQIKLLLTYSCHADTFTGRMGKVQTIVKKLVNEDILNQMYSSRKDLAKVLAMDQNFIEGRRVVILLAASCEGNRENFQPDGSNTNFALLIFV